MIEAQMTQIDQANKMPSKSRLLLRLAERCHCGIVLSGAGRFGGVQKAQNAAGAGRKVGLCEEVSSNVCQGV